MSGGYEFIGNGQAINRNFSSRPSAWNDFAQHRERIRALLVGSSSTPNPTLCVLGAGRCTDLDLESLVQHFSHITLVDIDGATLRDAVKARGFAENKQITVVGDVDLTGVNALLTKCKSDFSAENIEQVKTASKGFKIAELKQYDVVASTCLLSQLQNHVFISVGDRDQATFAELLAMTRQRHLELLLELTVAGGKAVLITDLTSSEAIPELKTTGLEIGLCRETIWARFSHLLDYI